MVFLHTKIISIILIFSVMILQIIEICNGQFYKSTPHPSYSLQNMPETSFSCRDKILGGYYADAETECQMFHVCVKIAGVGVSILENMEKNLYRPRT
jgi:hypothetical protein